MFTNLKRTVLPILAAFAGLVAVACIVATLPPQAHAQTFVSRAATWKPWGIATVTPASTFATTSYADLPGSSITFTPSRDPTTAAFQNGPTITQRLRVLWNLDAIKATTTTLTCALYVNGAVVAASARTIDVAAKNAVMGGLWEGQLTTAGSQVVKLQCKSGDTAVGTVNFGYLIADEIY